MKKMLMAMGLAMVMGTGMVMADAPQAVKKQTHCPIMGGTINTNVFTVYEGKKVYFCCKGCIAPFKKDATSYISKMEKEGIVLEKVESKEK
jgi:YHS domain-containing protein